MADVQQAAGEEPDETPDLEPRRPGAGSPGDAERTSPAAFSSSPADGQDGATSPSTASSSPADDGQGDDATSPAARTALAAAVREIELHVAREGWDAPVRVFALVRTQQALESEPTLADQLEPAVLTAARSNPWHLTSVEQEGLPPAEDVEDLLAQLSWPSTVDGVALTVERVVLPPAAEAAMPAEHDAAVAYLMAHPDRTDVRLAVGVLRDGASWCAVRTRTNDSDDKVGGGPDVVPGLVAALRSTLD